MTPPAQRTYVQKDGTIVPHASRPLFARFNELISSLVLFLTLFWQSLFQARFRIEDWANIRPPAVMTGRIPREV